MSVHEEIIIRLDDAARYAHEVPQFDTDNTLNLPDAYEIQRGSIARRLERGERRVGVKMGFTSRAKMVQMGLSDVIWGRLTDAMQLEEGSNVEHSRFVHPRVEPELAFLLKKPLAGNVTGAEALAAVEAIAPALEVIDSRYQNFKFTLPEVIADNASSSGFVVGGWHSPATDFGNLGLVMSLDGRAVQVGSTAALLGDPLRSLVAAARVSAAANEPLEAGWIVLAGGATPAEWIYPGQHISMRMQGLGSVSFQLV
ncbi:4-oxalocrotonate decarboxylase [Paraburkholderia xenovorans LB400]|uniref:4-oxalocrotonate decarboxylase n=4 Tax=Pseudomonadota TaxID=1224 RepID=A0A024HK95_PSEKB|nr:MULTISPECIES: fumarylacetoacetate hydrolase family protein [Pseudomonadota]MBO9332212.1 4-oxalocrotonate decarboxylase [Achromobacter xylosoxidans]ABE31798.1 4-oxalocrotonate decarboxylase [Paraburkholderia xenovorans LB400]AIP32055.1 4-oxalocrotonate decarboxylase [Paraburkholderia xenovorans LB400]MDD2012814.1 fumarylacetoacetate hydrolase family protein [Pseudomonas putida]CAB3939992.1 4-oxalocrotonate decarboxylase [Achromobacter insolitus]